MKRMISFCILWLCQLALFTQVGWATGSYLPTPPWVNAVNAAYTLTLKTSPVNAGSFNRNSVEQFDAGNSIYLRTYNNSGYTFDYWMSGDTIVSKEPYFYFTMPEHDAELTAVYHFDPSNPPNPDAPDNSKKYTLTLSAKPSNAGSFNHNSGEQYAAGENVYMYCYNNGSFYFDHWMSGDTIISTDRSFYFTMPEHDAELTAVYHYDPSNPANPDTAKVYYTVVLDTKPANAGSFSWNEVTEVVARSSCSIYAYNNTGYVFREWQQDGKTVGTDRRYSFQMPAENIHLTAVYDYNPSNPENPGKNYWNAETGEVIVDDFTPGNLYNAVYQATDGNYDQVQMITVAGPISQYDWGIVNNYGNCTFLDMSRTYGLTYVPSYNFSGNTTLTTVVLPSGIEQIEYYAFQGCSSLSSISIYASTPPTIGYRAFEGIGDSIVYVPADALALYQEAEGWKDFTILPLSNQVSALEVNLPEGTDPSIYKDMYIELVNTKSGQKQRYVITNRTTYTFSSLIHRTSYNVYLKNAQGDVLGEVDGIDIVDHDVSVTFESLMVPRDLTLQVLTPEGQDVTGQTTITWMDAKNTYLTKGSTLTGQLEGAKAKFRITLPQSLGMQYLLPADSLYEVQADNNISYTLTAIPQKTISGTVLDVKTGQPISGATVAISQMLNGIYSKAFTTKTDNTGAWSQTVYEAKTDITASMTDYVSKTQSFETLVAEVPAFELKDINGTTISLNLTYTTVDGETQSYYNDYTNVAYSIYNKTAGQQVTQMNVQYPQIVLMESLAEGTELVVTATSKNSKFVPVTATATVDSLDRANVTLPIVQLGGIIASFKQTDNNSIVGILYDSNNRLIKRYDYNGASLTISELNDGAYTLVTMANSQFFNSVATISQFAEAGLREGVDYVKNSVTVKSGAYTAINNQLIPFLDETKLYYTGDGTSISINKTEITSGNYLTISSHLNFKSAYANQVGDVKILVDLPENCSFVENSVMRGAQTAAYTYADNQVVVPLDYYGERVRFCFVPTVGGSFAATGSVQFTLNGKTITQPIGNVNFMVKDLSISVPSTVAKTTMPVSGTAPGKSSVEIYDDGLLIGNTTSLANGSWETTCELNEPYNLSTHNIYAKVTTKAGLELISETKQVVYEINMIVPEKVTMLYYNPEFVGQYNIVFDFINSSVSPKSYYFFPYKSYPNWWGSGTEPKEFTFVAELSNNDSTAVDGVTIRVYTDNGNWRNLEAQYNTSMNRWVAVGQFTEEEAPVGVEVDFIANSDFKVDRNQLSDELTSIDDAYINSLNEREELEKDIDVILPNQSVYDSIFNIFAADSIDFSRLNEELLKIVSPGDSIGYDVDALCQSVDELIDDINVLDIEADKAFASLLDDWYSKKDSLEDSNADFESSFETILGGKVISRTKLSSIDDTELEKEGYEKYQLTDNSFVFIKVDSISRSIIDGNTLYKYEERFVNDSDSINANSRRISSNLQSCISGFKMAVIQIQKTIEANGESMDEGKIRHYIAVLSSVVKDLGELLQCVYENSFVAISRKLEEKADLLAAPLKATEEKLLKKSSEIEAALASETSYNQTLQRSIQRYNDDLDWYKTKLALAETDVEINEIQEKINKTERLKASRIKELNKSAERCEKLVAKYHEIQEKLAKNAAKIAKRLEVIEKSRVFLRKVPTRLTDARLLKGLKIAGTAGKVIGTTVGALLQMIPLWIDCYDYSESLMKWGELWGKIINKLPCEGNESKMNLFVAKAVAATFTSVKAGASTIKAEAAALVLDVTNVPQAWLASLVLDVYSWVVGYANNKFTNWSREKLENELSKIKCGNDKCPRCGKKPCECKDKCPKCGNRPCTCPDKCPKCGKNPCVCPPPPLRTEPKHDPSGYVYESVASNRLQGVIASCYYKETVEDMYGDLHENVVLWDAEEYAQENPLFTDEYGMYRWDVPKGLWQVKFEKEGYQTTYSEWLPVPPPQLDVNIPMTQMLQPTVKGGKAFADGIEFEFDKYMDPESLTTDNIMVTKNGNAVTGEVKLLNEEVAYEGETQTYASKVRFEVPEGEELLSTDEVQLTVRKAVKSYAGVPMQDDYTQRFDVELQVRSMAIDSLINVAYGGTRTLTIAALPTDAAKGRTVSVKSLSNMIVKANVETLTLDDNGQAELVITGELPGLTVLNFTVDGSDVEGQMKVNVKDAVNLVAIAPRASRVSGTEVYRGTKIQLTSETENAVIYYTLDGSCPCDENNPNVLTYNPDEPIVIADDYVIIKAMATGHDLGESEVSEFTYSLKKTTVGYNMPAGWTWISHNLENAVSADEFKDNAKRIMSQTDELVKDPSWGFVGTLTELQPAVGYKVQLDAAMEKSLKGYEFNAVQNTVSVAAGWTWIGYPLNQTMTVNEALYYFNASTGDYIVGQEGFAEFDGNEWKGTLEGLKPGQSYLFKSATAAEISFNTNIVSDAVSRIGKRNLLMNSPWAYNYHAYPNLMPVTAELFADGSKADADDYLVGAFAGGECRGIGLWKDARLLMSVYGDNNEEIRFVAADLDNEKFYDITETLNFTADNQGSWLAPMALTIGDESTGMRELYNELMITPAVARDHITVNAGGRYISRLTITNMKGVTVLSINDLGTGGTVTTGSLQDGLYIVTVQAEGNTYYKKIIKANK